MQYFSPKKFPKIPANSYEKLNTQYYRINNDETINDFKISTIFNENDWSFYHNVYKTDQSY